MQKNDADHSVIKYHKVRDHFHYTGKYRGSMKHEKKFLQQFIMVLHMIFILKSINQQKNLRVNLNAWKKYRELR